MDYDRQRLIKCDIHSESMKTTFKELRERGNEIIEILNSFPNSEEKQHLINIVAYLKERMRVT